MIMVTGSNGFVGRHIVRDLASAGKKVVAAYRSEANPEWSEYSLVTPRKVPSLGMNADWTPALEDVVTVVHCAGVAHGKSGDGWSANVEGTRTLALQAAAKGVRRFVFLSSVAAHGHGANAILRDDQTPVAVSEYGRQKLAAEKMLFQVSETTGLEVVIVRPPLIYGNGAPGNFGLLCRILETGVPLPFSSIQNRRSFLSIYNLADFVSLCISHPDAVGKSFLVSDDITISTSQFLRMVGTAMGRPPRLFWLPDLVLSICAKLTGKRHVYDQLYGNLEIEILNAKTVLSWTPPYSIEESLSKSFLTGAAK